MHNWQAYRVILRLHSPLHIGWGKVSYLQRTRPYVSGRVLRGALVNRVGRNGNIHGEDPRDPFRCVSKTFAQYLTYTYFYPALKPEKGDWQVCFPWENEANFRRRFLSSYTSTALSYPLQSAEEGSLHEIEFISPYTLDKGDPVYLMGYIFVDEGREKYDWQGAFKRIQLGGERGYGWGEARAEEIEQVNADSQAKIRLFDRETGFKSETKRPCLELGKGARAWAHVRATPATSMSGAVEPVVGREWRAEGSKKGKRKHIGQHLAFDEVYFAPGSLIPQETPFSIEEGGYWRSGEAR